MTPNEVAYRYGVGIRKVLGWIERGELKAVNVATDPKKQPRWSILPGFIEEFERSRAPKVQKPAPRTRRPKPDPSTIKFF